MLLDDRFNYFSDDKELFEKLLILLNDIFNFNIDRKLLFVKEVMVV
jgi:hypothetical protein